MPDVTISDRLSLRQAQIIARWLKDEKASKLSATACQYQTPEQIAEKILGNGNRGVSKLADEIRERLGQGG